jgi:methionyl-tRNA formyltransferase
LDLEITQPASIKNNDEFRQRLLRIKPDAIIVVGYGRIIPQWMIELPRFGNINLHASLLPKYRGAAPIQWAIANGDQRTGVTTMRIDAGLDTGDILLQQEVPIAFEDTAETLGPELATIGAALMLDTLRGMEAGSIRPSMLDHAKATLAPILKKEDGRVDFRRSAHEIYNRLRGFQPWPGAYTIYRGRNLQIHRATPVKESSALASGQISTASLRLVAGCGENSALELIEVQPEGKRRMAARDFINGYHPTPGEKLGQ